MCVRVWVGIGVCDCVWVGGWVGGRKVARCFAVREWATPPGKGGEIGGSTERLSLRVGSPQGAMLCVSIAVPVLWVHSLGCTLPCTVCILG